LPVPASRRNALTGERYRVRTRGHHAAQRDEPFGHSPVGEGCQNRVILATLQHHALCFDHAEPAHARHGIRHC
jgi:hypothetical protein